MLTTINGGACEVNRTVGGNALIEGSVVSGAVVNPLTAGGSITSVAAEKWGQTPNISINFFVIK